MRAPTAGAASRPFRVTVQAPLPRHPDGRTGTLGPPAGTDPAGLRHPVGGPGRRSAASQGAPLASGGPAV